MPTTSVLSISGIDFPDEAARGARQTLAPIDGAKNYRRTVNGVLVDISDSLFRLWRSTITCSDQAVPEMIALWPGTEVTVDCIVELTGTPNRTVVTGSQRTVDGIVRWRPQLVMMVTDYSIEEDEYGQEIGWSIDLEEVGPAV